MMTKLLIFIIPLAVMVIRKTIAPNYIFEYHSDFIFLVREPKK